MSLKVEPKIPVLDLQPEIEEQWDELMEAIEGVIRSRQFILGPNVKAFEAEVAAYLGVKHAVGVNSGTDALVISLRASGVGPQDEVITSPFTFFATPESISNVGGTPVFVDIDPVTFNIDPALIELAIGPRTKAIMPVHLYGQACDMDPIVDIAGRHGLKVIEDVAQSLGGTYRGTMLGGIGDAAALSFFPSKNLGGFGDGGMVVTNDDQVAEQARMLRAHGAKRKYANEVLGYNSRLDELQAAILRVRLRHFDRSLERRRRVARRYDDALAGVVGLVHPAVAPGVGHGYHQYTVRITGGRRDGVAAALAQAGIDTAIYYPIPTHRLPVYRASGACLPGAETAAGEVLSLPMGPSLEEPAARRVLEAVMSAVADTQ